jgi:transposase
VIRVPPNMMARARQTERVRGKSDPIDATAVARAAIREPDLPRAFLAGQRSASTIKAELAPIVREHAPELLTIPGCGTIVAARIVAEVANVTRFSTDAQLALYAGVAPLDASSGRQQRHRLNRTGNRKLNHAIHVIAVTQARIYAPAKDYLARKTAAGKSTKEALRAFKRLLIRRIFALLKANQRCRTIDVDALSITPCLT